LLYGAIGVGYVVHKPEDEPVGYLWLSSAFLFVLLAIGARAVTGSWRGDRNKPE
jgi:hypothetical protein